MCGGHWGCGSTLHKSCRELPLWFLTQVWVTSEQPLVEAWTGSSLEGRCAHASHTLPGVIRSIHAEPLPRVRLLFPDQPVPTTRGLRSPGLGLTQPVSESC